MDPTNRSPASNPEPGGQADASIRISCAARCRMARGRWPRRVRLGHRVRHPHAALPCGVARRDHAADRPHGARERARGLARDAGRAGRAERAALHAGRRLPGRAAVDRRLPARALAALDLPPRGRQRGDPGGRRLPRALSRGRALVAPLAAVGRSGRGVAGQVGERGPNPFRSGDGPQPRPDRPIGPADGPAAALGARLSRAASREPRLRFQRRGHGRPRPVAAVPGRAADLGGDRRQLSARPHLAGPG
jgi:hypothetical protein